MLKYLFISLTVLFCLKSFVCKQRDPFLYIWSIDSLTMSATVSPATPPATIPVPPSTNRTVPPRPPRSALRPPPQSQGASTTVPPPTQPQGSQRPPKPTRPIPLPPSEESTPQIHQGSAAVTPTPKPAHRPLKPTRTTPPTPSEESAQSDGAPATMPNGSRLTGRRPTPNAQPSSSGARKSLTRDQTPILNSVNMMAEGAQSTSVAPPAGNPRLRPTARPQTGQPSSSQRRM